MFIMTELNPDEAAFLVDSVTNWWDKDTKEVRLIGGGHATFRYYMTSKGRQVRIEFDGEDAQEDLAYCLIEIMTSSSKLKALYNHNLAKVK